ncbi:hypothetical protein BDZ94DRAFT_737770 [Collybia nuda]|uniref:F-box domain-containing protein n=1 Tax=Collybia nuda TaxID=64659 RepID=A0A9P5Y4Y3_9AGAR|nr:hypothetical protein BDZ94DRAFT_737770 [Collybia nuda]
MQCVASRETSRTQSQVSYNTQPFPPEIINRIIDELSLWEDKTTILACTLTSPSFRYFSQKRLFEKITLSTKHKNETNTLFTLLYKNPDLVSHIREVSLIFISDPEGSHDGDFGGSPGDMLPDVITKLRNVVSLNFTDLFYHEHADSRVGLTLDTQKALLQLGHCAQITYLQFDEVRRWPVSFLCHFPQLRRIEINSSWDPFVDNATSDLPAELGHIVGTPSELKELQIKYSNSPTLFSCIGASHSGLCALAVYSDDASYTSTIEELVRSSAATLERLKVYHDQGAGKSERCEETVNLLTLVLS